MESAYEARIRTDRRPPNEEALVEYRALEFAGETLAWLLRADQMSPARSTTEPRPYGRRLVAIGRSVRRWVAEREPAQAGP